MSDAPSQSQDKFIIRLPEGMRDRIKFAADANNRSMNAEIVATLEAAYPEENELEQAAKDLVTALEGWRRTVDPDQMQFMNAKARRAVQKIVELERLMPRGGERPE